MPHTPSFSLSIEGQERSDFLVLGFDIAEKSPSYTHHGNVLFHRFSPP
jgi:hypothetical protein